MKIYINRTHCDACQSFCDRHVAKLVRFPEGEDRPCIQNMEDDGLAEIMLVVTDNDKVTTLTLDEQMRQVVALEGLSNFIK